MLRDLYSKNHDEKAPHILYLFRFFGIFFAFINKICIAFEPFEFEEKMQAARTMSERSVKQISQQKQVVFRHRLRRFHCST